MRKIPVKVKQIPAAGLFGSKKLFEFQMVLG
jgi:hypothetical protein